MKKDYILICLMITSFILINSSHSSKSQIAQTWPSFRGTNCTGIAASDQDPPIVFGPNQNVLWKITLPEGHSSPCIWGNSIFLTGFEEEGKLLKIFCIDRNKGTIRWEKNISVKEFEKPINDYPATDVRNPATATPTTDGEKVYFYFGSYGLLCYDFDGKLQWELPLPVPISIHGMGTSPVVTDDLVILNCFNDLTDPRLLAINKHDGSTVWKYSLPKQAYYSGDSYSTPVIYRDQLIIYTSEDVAGYSLITGKQLWRFLNGCADAVCTPVIGSDLLYIIGFNTFGNPNMMAQFPEFTKLVAERDKNGDSRIDKKEMEDFQFLMYPEKPEVSKKLSFNDYFGEWLDKNKDQYYDETEWKILIEFMESYYQKQGLKAIKLGGNGDISINNYVWGNAEQTSHVSSPLYYKNHVYIIKDGGGVTCFNAENGKVLYQERLGATGAYFSSPIAVNDRIYIASRNGIVTVFEAGDKLKILAKNDLGDIITATPAVVDHGLYIRTAKSFYVFRK